MNLRLALAAAIALSACSGSSSGVSASDVAAFQSSALAASTAVTTYREATQTMTTPAGCQAAVQQYANEMGAAAQGMSRTSSRMDEHMRSMGQSAAADMTCGAEVMAQALQQHLGVACSSGDMAQNRTVAAQHCQQMAADADHLQMRAAAMSAMFGHGDMMMGDSDMSTMMTSMMDGGYTAPDGEHMSWTDPMPGCTFSGGTYRVTADAGTAAGG
jgi:hypothetical protein